MRGAAGAETAERLDCVRTTGTAGGRAAILTLAACPAGVVAVAIGGASVGMNGREGGGLVANVVGGIDAGDPGERRLCVGPIRSASCVGEVEVPRIPGDGARPGMARHCRLGCTWRV